MYLQLSSLNGFIALAVTELLDAEVLLPQTTALRAGGATYFYKAMARRAQPMTSVRKTPFSRFCAKYCPGNAASCPPDICP